MRLGLNLGYWGPAGSGHDPHRDLDLVLLAEAEGYDVCWSSEAYGSDAVSVLGWLAAQTSRIDLGSAVMQIPARTPAATAMTAATLDTLSGGRFRLGLGVSGPQVSEGWHGVRFARPLARTREYVEVVRSALARETLRHDGEHYPLPLPGGPGKPLRLTITPPDHGPRRGDRPLPVYLAAVGPRNVELTGEVADGWLGVLVVPEQFGPTLDLLRRGAAGRPTGAVDAVASVPVVVLDDVTAAADAVRPYVALYLGGMGSRTQNFYTDLAARSGFEREARHVQDLYLDRRHREAAAAVPDALVDAVALVGPADRVARRVADYERAGVDTLSVLPLAPDHEGRRRAVRAVAGAAA